MMITLYALPASHPCAAVEAALRLKGISYRRIDMLPLSQLLAGPVLYRGTTVPGIRGDGVRVVGSRAIMRRLDELAPEPPLLPPDPAAKVAVLDAERWGDVVLQSAVRRILNACFVRSPHAMEGYAGGARLPIPVRRMRPAMPLTARLLALRNKARDSTVAADIATLPDQLQAVDDWIAAGVLGADRPNAADLQIGSSIRLLRTIADLRALLEGRLCAELTRHFPPQQGEIPPGTLPPEWLPRHAV